MELILDIIRYLPELLTGCLAILGVLKVLARHTKSTADDRFLDALEKPLELLKNALRPKK